MFYFLFSSKNNAHRLGHSVACFFLGDWNSKSPKKIFELKTFSNTSLLLLLYVGFIHTYIHIMVSTNKKVIKNTIDVNNDNLQSKHKISNINQSDHDHHHHHHKDKDPEIGSLIAFFTYLSFALITLV